MCVAGGCQEDGEPAGLPGRGKDGEGAARPVVTGGADRPVYRRRVVDRGQCRETSRDTVREGGLSTERHGSRR